MQQEEDAYRFPSGRSLHRYVFRPAGPPVAGMLLVHGLGDHLRRYASLGRFLAARGILGMGVDFPGHGLSKGQRGHLPGWDSLVEIQDDLVMQLRLDLPDGAQLGLFAHSFGAFLGIDYLARRPGVFQMAWLSSPLVDPGLNKPAALIRMAGILGTLLPRLPMDTGVRTAQCREEGLPADEGGGKADDDLLHHVVSVGFGAELVARAASVRASASRLRPELALLMTHGTADSICPASLSRDLFERMPCRRKTFVEIAGALHEPLHGVKRAEVWNRAGRWLDDLGLPEKPGQ